jgi:tripartite-type tricarboxylate transporter receptor subunit TctC
MRTTRRTVLAGLALLPGAAVAQDAPDRPVQLIIPFAPGASADGTARILAAALGARLRQQITPDNRPGAGGSLGLSMVARAAPDGTTLGIGATGAVVINPHTPEATPLRPLQQLTPVARLAGIPLVIVASRASGIASLADLVARSRGTQGGLSFGTTGTNSAQHLAVELLRARSGADLVHVPYRGSAPALTDAISGTLPLASVDLTSAAPAIAAGTVTAIAVTSPERSALAPGVPTVAEGGFPGYSATAWLGLFGPAGMAPALVTRLSDAVGAVLATPAERDRILALAAEPAFLPAAEFAGFLAEESAKWAEVIASLRR